MCHDQEYSFILTNNNLNSGPATAHDVKGSTYCEFYNDTMCGGELREDCFEKEQCGPHEPDKRNHCYVLWQLDSITKKSTIKLKVSYSQNLDSIIHALFSYFIKLKYLVL